MKVHNISNIETNRVSSNKQNNGNIDINLSSGVDIVPKKEAKQIVDDLLKSKQDKDALLNNVDKITKTRSYEVLNIVVEEYFKQAGKSFIGELFRTGCMNNETIRNAVKNLIDKNSLAHRDYIAVQIRKVFNQDDKNLIKSTFKALDSNNIQDVYTLYHAQAKQSGEVAATDREKAIIDDPVKRLWYTRSIKKNPNRPETLFQGILKNNSLSTKEKRDYLTKTVDLFIARAKNINLDKQKIDKFSKDANVYIDRVLSSESDLVQNADMLENILAELYGWE